MNKNVTGAIFLLVGSLCGYMAISDILSSVPNPNVDNSIESTLWAIPATILMAFGIIIIKIPKGNKPETF